MEKISENTMDRLTLNLKMIKASFVVPALMMLPAISGHAAENGNYSFPAGASLYLIGGFPPVPGNYLQVMAAHTDSSRLNNSRGDEIKGTDFDLKVNAATVRFFTVWDSHIFGADSFASELIGTYAHAKNSMNTPDGHFSDSQDGLGDIIIGPFLFQWDLNGKKLNDSKTKGFGIGPTLQYQFPNHSVVIASWQKDIVAENKSENNNFYLTYMFKY